MTRRCSAALVALLMLWAAPAAHASQQRVSQRGARDYKSAEQAVAQGKYDEARQILAAALGREPLSGSAPVGMMSEPYYPHYLLGVIHMEQGRYADAVAEFRLEVAQGQVQQDAAIWEELQQRLGRAERTDTQSPVIGDVESEVLQTAFRADGRETAEVRFRGKVFDGGGIASLTVDGQALSFRETDDGFLFEERLALDAGRTAVELVARDTAGNEVRRLVSYDLPPLELGAAAGSLHAVLVGVDRYDRSWRDDAGRCLPETNTCGDPAQFACYGLPDLSAAAADARRFHDLLVRRGVPQRNLHLLVSDGEQRDATRDNVLRALEALKGEVGDKVIFYFSGHGVNSRRHKNLMLLSDTRGFECGDAPEESKTALEASALGIDEVERALMEAPFAERYVILDACRTPRLASTRAAAADSAAPPAPGFATPGTRGLSQVLFRGLPAERVSGTPPVVFYATRERNVSVEWAQKQSGYFTWFLLQGLRRDLSLDALKDFVQEQVRETTRENHCAAGATDCPFEQLPYLDLPPGLREDYARQRDTFILAAAPAPAPEPQVTTRGGAPPRTRRVVVVPDEDRQYFEQRKKVAVVVGVGSYGKFSGLAPLRYTVPDADAVAGVLEAQGFEVVAMRDTDVTRETVPETLRRAADLLDPAGSTFMFFFSGHGFAEKGRNYLATIDTTAKRVAQTGLPLDEVLGIMESSRARRRVAFVDACRSAVPEGSKGGPRSFAELERSEGTRLLFSTRQGDYSYEDPELGHGLFSYFLVRGLEGEAAGNDGLVTFRDLADYVQSSVATYALKRGWEQTPFDAGEATGVFMLGRAGVRPAASAPLALVVPALALPGADMLLVAAGRFEMGSADGDADERPVRAVEISRGFRLDRTEVTVAQYAAFLDAQRPDEAQRRRWVALAGEAPEVDAVAPAIARSPEGYRALRPDHPVTHVTWEGAMAYCRARGATLPTEAQWEHAARRNGWTGVADPARGNFADRSLRGRVLDLYGEHDDGHAGTSPVCEFASRADALGLCDLGGNVAEWVRDAYDENAYAVAAQTDPLQDGAGQERVVRGSSWHDGPAAARVSRRLPLDTTAHNATVGFRCAE